MVCVCVPVPRDNWGGIDNDTGDGQIGAIFYHEVDIAIGCIYNWLVAQCVVGCGLSRLSKSLGPFMCVYVYFRYFNVFDTSKSIAKSAVTLLVPGAL